MSFFLFFYAILGFGGLGKGLKKRIISEIDSFFDLFYGVLGFGGEGVLEKKIMRGSIKLVWIDLESAMIDLESTQVLIGPGNTGIVHKNLLRQKTYYYGTKQTVN